MKDPIYILFEKYANGTISKEEWKQLSEIIPTLPDQSIQSILEEIWLQYEYSGKKRAQSFEKIDQLIRQKGKKNITSYFSLLRNIAAAGLLILAGTFTYKAINNKPITETSGINYLEVIAGRGERATVKLPDGSTVKLNAGSSLSYPSDFGKIKRELILSGEGYFKVEKNKKKPFIVQTPDIHIRVHGTTFNVVAYENSPVVETSLMEGSVSLYSTDNSFPERLLEPDQKAILHRQEKQLMVENTKAEEDISWLSGKFIFRSTPLNDVLQELCRYYGYTLNHSGAIDLQDRFSGTFENENMTEMLEALQYHYNFQFQMNNDNLTIKFNE
ncbi:MAG: FecR family protein [Bacteroidales bacterium]